MNTDIIREKQDLIEDKKNIFANKLSEEDKETIFENMQGILPEKFFDKVWNMIYMRYKVYENL